MKVQTLTRVLLAVALLASAEGCKRHRPGSVVGSWSTDTDNVHVQMLLNPDGTWQMKGSGPSAPGTTLTASGTWSLTGTTLAFTPTSADVTGAMPEEQREATRQKILQAEPDNQIDFVSPDQFVETAPDGREMTFKRMP